MSTTTHTWRFYRAGGLDQVRFETGADIANLDTLDPKLWVALACPVKGLEFDERTLTLIDTDGDSRVRAPEIIGAVTFLKSHLKSLDNLIKGDDELALADIDENTAGGRSALASAKHILSILGKPNATHLSCADIKDLSVLYKNTPFNGDGIITPAGAGTDTELATVIKDIITTQGGVADNSGEPGVDKTRIDAFFTELKALAAWCDKVDADPVAATFGANMGAAVAAVKAVRTKIDDYFLRCYLASFETPATPAVTLKDGTLVDSAALPVARPQAAAALPLTSGVNPAWGAAMENLIIHAITPIFGANKTALSESEWRTLLAKITAIETLLAAKPAGKAASLTTERIREITALNAAPKLASLLETEAATTGIADIEKLVRLNRDFIRLLNNFVSFGDFYSKSRIAIFQVGRLYLDSRECHLCIRVEDAGKHAAMAGLSKCYLAYCDITRKGGAEKQHILAVFSEGDCDYLMVGRNGIFIDRKGQDWDATITKIIDAPISIRQAFFAPYKKFVRFVEEQVAKRAAAADDETNSKMAAHADKVANADKLAHTPREPKKIDLGTIALISTAVTGLAAIVGGLLQAFFGLQWLMPLGIIGLIMAISGPSMLIAALKLRQRNLGPILDSNGWAMNGRVKVNIPLGTSLTDAADLPENSTLSLDDPFAEKRSVWPRVIAVVLVLLAMTAGLTYAAWRFNFKPFDDFLRNYGMPSLIHKTPEEIDALAKAKAELELATKAKKSLELENKQDKAKLEIEKLQLEKAKAEAEKAKAEAEAAKAETPAK